MALTDKQCRNAKVGEKITKMADGNGLSLVIHPNGSKYWHGRYRKNGKEQTKTLGKYPDVSLSDARQAWATYKVQGEGVSTEVTFAVMFTQYYNARHKNGYKPTDNIPWAYDNFPEWFKHKRMTDITMADVSAVILEATKQGGVLAQFMSSVCNRVCEFAIDCGVIQTSPAYRAKRLVPRHKVTHNRSISPERVGLLLTYINSHTPQLEAVCDSFKLQMLTATRINEATGIRWDELDLDNKLWTIPASRMKTKETHIVPLSDQAITIIRQYAGRYSNKVFWEDSVPNASACGRVKGLLRRSAFHNEHVTHGCRSLFLTVMQEEFEYPFDVVDAQLAHKKAGGVRQAYDRATFLDKRVVAMQVWADWLDAKTKEAEGSVGGITYPYA
ncbi:tyrosine-type recombinase/integrase [Pelistega indica]|nr:integrase arm-type DNA-binding domain-containing protein [Pelistega indica]